MTIQKNNNKVNTKKVATTIPEDLLREIDELSNQKGISRSRLISDLLREELIDEQNHSLRCAYDEVFSNDAVCREQILAAPIPKD